MNNNIREDIAKELKELLSGKAMKPLSGYTKKCYKYALTAVFINMCGGREQTIGQKENYELLYNIKKEPKLYNNGAIFEDIKLIVETSLKSINVHDYDKYETIDKIIILFREIIKDTEKYNTCLINVKEIDKLIDVNAYFKNMQNIQAHHWINFDILGGMVYTIPEFFTYTDIINSWNILLDKIEEHKEEASKTIYSPMGEALSSSELRSLKYEIDTLCRTLWVASVTFTESMLYYLFYNLKEGNYQPKTKAAEELLKLRKIEDEQIIGRLIIPEFVQGKNNNLNNLIKEYKNINKKRNRFIHPSAFPDSTESSELLPFVNTKIEEVIDTLNVSTRLAKMVDDCIPEEYKVLFWWDRVEHPDFTNYKKGSIVSWKELKMREMSMSN